MGGASAPPISLFPGCFYALLYSSTRHDLTVGGNPLAVASADFNGDGKQDIAVLFGPTGATTTFVAVFLGNGDGTFTLFPAGGFDTGFAAPWLITADLNHDNKPDLVIANGFGRSISVLLGNGDGTLGTKNIIPLPGRIESVIAADFNGDGKLDLAAPDFEPRPYAVSILLGNGDGTFGPNTEYPTLDVPFVVIADDFNRDGKLDLALNTDLGTVSVIGSVLLGNGDGTFQLKKDFSTGFTQSADLASGDFNSDGKPDLVVTNNADDSVSILLGNGDGTFTLQSSIALPVTPFRVLARDIDADGKLDLVVARRNSAAISILTGNGNGTFGTPIDFSTGAGPQFLVVKDLNGDGLLDLVTANNDDGTVSILLNTTAQALTAACTVNGSTAPVTVLVTSYVAYNANPNPASGSTCDWNPGTPLPGAFDTAAGSSCAPSSPIYTAIAGGTFSENVTVTNGSNVVTLSCPALTVQDFSLSVTPLSATALPSSVVAYTVTASSINGFTGQINLVQSTTLPSGVSAAWSPTSQFCTVPAGGSCSAIYTVTVGAGASAADIGLVFHGTYAPVLTTRSASATLHVLPPAPIINSISPLSGNQGQTLTVTVTGSNFQTGATLSFSGTGVTVPPLTRACISATDTNCVSPTQIRATISVLANAPVELKDIFVTNPGGQVSNTLGGFRADAEFLIFGGAANEAADEPSIAVDPNNPDHLVAGYNIHQTVDGQNYVVSGCGWSESINGGYSWPNKGRLTFEYRLSFVPRGDPWVRFSPDGKKIFYSCLASSAFDSKLVAIFFAVSKGGAATFKPASLMSQSVYQRCHNSGQCPDEPSFDILTRSDGTYELVAAWAESKTGQSLLRVATSVNNGDTWSLPITVGPSSHAFSPKIGTIALPNAQSAVVVTWLDQPTDTLFFSASSDGVNFTPAMKIATSPQALLDKGSTTSLVFSRADAFVLPRQDHLLAIWQLRQPSNISNVFMANPLELQNPQDALLGGDTAEKFLPGVGTCGNAVGTYQVTDPNSRLFRYTVWSLTGSAAIGPIFTSSAALNGQDGILDSNFPSYTRIGEYTSVDCSGQLGWGAWTDLRNHKAEIWAARIPLQQ